MRSRLSLFICVVASGLIHPEGSLATSAFTGPCVVTATWKFSPPLTRTIQAGTLEIIAEATCVDARASNEPPGQSTRVVSGPSHATFAYFGNCVTAQVASADIVATMVGGSTFASASLDSSRVPDAVLSTFASGWIMTPDEVCNESSATGRAVGGPVIIDG